MARPPAQGYWIRIIAPAVSPNCPRRPLSQYQSCVHCVDPTRGSLSPHCHQAGCHPHPRSNICHQSRLLVTAQDPCRHVIDRQEWDASLISDTLSKETTTHSLSLKSPECLVQGCGRLGDALESRLIRLWRYRGWRDCTWWNVQPIVNSSLSCQILSVIYLCCPRCRRKLGCTLYFTPQTVVVTLMDVSPSMVFCYWLIWFYN